MVGGVLPICVHQPWRCIRASLFRHCSAWPLRTGGCLCPISTEALEAPPASRVGRHIPRAGLGDRRTGPGRVVDIWVSESLLPRLLPIDGPWGYDQGEGAVRLSVPSTVLVPAALADAMIPSGERRSTLTAPGRPRVWPVSIGVSTHARGRGFATGAVANTHRLKRETSRVGIETRVGRRD